MDLDSVVDSFLDGDPKGWANLWDGWQSRVKKIWKKSGESFHEFVVDLTLYGRRVLTIAARKHRQQRASRPAENANHLKDYLPTRHATDLYLAVGCGVPDDVNQNAAKARFMQNYTNVIRGTVRSYLLRSHDAEDAQSNIISLILMSDFPEPGKTALIHQYEARSSLKWWLRAVVARRCINYLEKLKAEHQKREPIEKDPPARENSRPPSAALVKGLEATLCQTVASMAAEDMLLLQYRYLDGLPNMAIGQLVFARKVSEPTVSRRIKKARNCLVDLLLQNIDNFLHRDPDILEQERDRNHVVSHVLRHVLQIDILKKNKMARKPAAGSCLKKQGP